MKRILNFALLLLIAITPLEALAKKSVPFTLKSKYVETMGQSGKCYDAVKDFGMVPNSEADQSAALQQAITKVSNKGGGELVIPAGTYRFSDVYMKSGVHILVDSKAILKPYRVAKSKNTIMLNFTTPNDNSAEYIENCSIRGVDGKFTVDYSDVVAVNEAGGKMGVRFAIARMVKNFMIADVHILDNHTTHCGLVFVPSSCEGADKFEVSRPTNGEVRNCSIENADSGYGLCQLHGAQGLYFEDIFAQGGITLRLESGAGGKYAGVYDVEAKNVGSKNARATVMMSPHCTENGRVLIDGVSSESSSAAVILHNGFIDSKNKHNENAKHGTYSNESKIYNIHAISGDNAQVAVKELWMVEPVDGAYDTYRESGYNAKEVIGRGYAAVFDGTLGEYSVECANIVAEGFPASVVPILYETNIMDRHEKRWDIVNSVPVMVERKENNLYSDEIQNNKDKMKAKQAASADRAAKESEDTDEAAPALTKEEKQAAKAAAAAAREAKLAEKEAKIAAREAAQAAKAEKAAAKNQ